MFKQIYFFTFAVALIASGCSSDGNERRQKYLDADYYTRLEIPPDLTSTVDQNKLTEPKPTKEALEKFKKETANLGSGTNANQIGKCP